MTERAKLITKQFATIGAQYVEEVVVGIEEPVKSCNRHSHCKMAESVWLKNHPEAKRIPLSFHCHDDDCEDCFGS